jgi:hypothetical protein
LCNDINPNRNYTELLVVVVVVDVVDVVLVVVDVVVVVVDVVVVVVDVVVVVVDAVARTKKQLFVLVPDPLIPDP